ASMPSRTRLISRGPARGLLLDAYRGDEAGDVGIGNVVQLTLVLFFESFAQIFRGNETRFAVPQITPRLGPEPYRSGWRQAHHQGIPVHKEFGIDRVGVAGGDSVPHVRETALIDLAGQLGSDLEGAHELAHGAVVGQDGICGHALAPPWLYRFATLTAVS